MGPTLHTLFRPKSLVSRVLFETLDWVLPRRETLKYMALDTLDESEPSSGLLAALTSGSGGGSGSSSDALSSLRFWCTAFLAKRLADWAQKCAGVLHGCPCQPERRGNGRQEGANKQPSCPIAGRMSVPLASAVMVLMADMTLKPVTQAALRDLREQYRRGSPTFG